MLNRNKSFIFASNNSIKTMTKYLYRTLLCIATCFAVQILAAQNPSTSFADGNNQYVMRKSNLSDIGTTERKLKPFTFGAEVGASIDMSGNDMSSIEIDAYFGYKNDVIRTLGIGAGIKSAIGNSYTFLPVYAMLRTSFTSRPSLCFLDMRLGYSFNTLKDDVTQNSFFGSAGLGFNLYTSHEFKSHIILAYTFMNMEDYHSGEYLNELNNFNGMSVRIGISF